MKTYSNSINHLPTFKDLLPKNHLTDNLKTCYVALGIKCYRYCSNGSLRLILSFSTAMSNFVAGVLYVKMFEQMSSWIFIKNFSLKICLYKVSISI